MYEIKEIINKILCGDCLKELKEIPSNSIDTVCTSPPYWALRNYGIEGQIGLEPTFSEYVNKLCDIFDEVKRILKKTGTCWINLGDTYCSKGETRHKGYGDPKQPKLGIKEYNEPSGLPQIVVEKSLCNIPARFSIEMQNRGWILRNVIIWHKPNAMPSSVKDRFTVDFEYVFFFVKNKKYWFETQYEPHKLDSIKRACRARTSDKLNANQYSHSRPNKNTGYDNMMERLAKGELNHALSPEGRNKRTVWAIEESLSKYDIIKEGHSNRAGLQRGPTLREKRIHQIIQPLIAEYLRKYLTAERRKILDETFGQHKWNHWIRADESGASLPSPEDWWQLKEILDFDNKYDDMMTETETYLDDGITFRNQNKNKRTVWTITTKGFPESHFAVYPEELCETPLKAGCPDFVCNKCGKPREKIIEYEYKGRTKFGKELSPNSKFSDVQGNLEITPTKQIFKGWKECNCNAGFSGGIVLDPFSGAGTTLLVALKQNKRGIGIELNPEYCKIAKERLKPYLEQTKLAQEVLI